MNLLTSIKNASRSELVSAKKRSLAKFFYIGIVPIFFTASADAYQILPNPNPAGNIIVVLPGSTAENAGTFFNLGMISNQGTLNNQSAAFLNNAGDLPNDGLLINQPGATIANFNNITINAGSTFVNAGTFANTIGTLTLQEGSTLEFSSGTLEMIGGQVILNRNFSFGDPSSGTVNLYGGTLVNNGRLTNVSGHVQSNKSNLVNNSQVQNLGTFNNLEGGVLRNTFRGTLQGENSTFNNFGETINEGTATLGPASTLFNGAGGQLTNAASLHIEGLLENAARGQISNFDRIVVTSLHNSGQIVNLSGPIPSEFSNVHSGEKRRRVIGYISSELLTNAEGGNFENRARAEFGAVRNNTGATLTNHAVLAGGPGNIVNNGTLFNTGRLETGDGNILNLGTFVVAESGRIEGPGIFMQGRGATTINGNVTVPLVGVGGGVLQGTGTINGHVTVFGGTMAPDDLSVNGNLRLGQSGILDFDVFGAPSLCIRDVSVARVTAPACIGGGGPVNDVLNIFGDLEIFGGILNIDFNKTSDSSINYVWDLLSADAIFGLHDLSFQFDNVPEGLRPQVLTSDTRISVQLARGPAPVPEPSTLLLIASSLLFMTATRRKSTRVAPGSST